MSVACLALTDYAEPLYIKVQIMLSVKFCAFSLSVWSQHWD